MTYAVESFLFNISPILCITKTRQADTETPTYGYENEQATLGRFFFFSLFHRKTVARQYQCIQLF